VSAITVRHAEAADAAALAAVHVDGWRAAYRGLVPDELLDSIAVGRRESGWRERLADQADPSVTLVAELGGAVAGFCSVIAPARDDDAEVGTAEIAAIYIDPARWRTGVGSALLGAALGDLERDGWQRVTLWVLAGNHPALAFYARFGFEPDGTSKELPGLGAAEVRLARRGDLGPPT
jgi:ribosomal protein S18 acetylase RimI-like enzyme